MQQPISEPTHPGIAAIQGMLRKVDSLQVPIASRHDVQSILVCQASKEIDRTLPWQAGHGLRTAILAVTLGQALGLATEALHHLKLASYLHDIGLLLLPPRLAAHRGFVESELYVAIQNHPRHGAALLEPFSFLRDASTFIAHHHERWDGSGYPYGIRGRFIPLGARILSLADAFDAIRIPNVSNPVARNRVALRIIRVAAGTQFDPELVEIFCQLQKPTSGSVLTELVARNSFDSR